MRPPAGDAGFFASLDRYFERTLREHGPTARGVDWNSDDSQRIRFEQLLRVHRGEGAFSLNDYGCGVGALATFLHEHGHEGTYRGFDISDRMIEAARSEHADCAHCSFVTSAAELAPADYTVASGVFNLRLDVGDDAWREYVLDTLADIDRVSVHGFAFNMLTRYSDAGRMRPDLYYGDPAFFFDHCKRTYSRNVALLHDYELYEFTIVVRT